jgi:membrane-associated protease RseP (regulator of RpoE activity)
VSQPPGLLGPLDRRSPEPPQSWVTEESPQSLRWSLPGFWWLNLLLLLFTGATTTVFGSALVDSFARGRPFDQNDLLNSFLRLLHGDRALAHGLIFSAPLLLILMAHEMGHYILCLKRGVDATLPYFMPSPTLFGTLGAFIRIKTPIYTRRALFDIGSAGPLAGFLMLLPFLFAGVWLSHPLADGDQHALLVATPIGLRALEWLRFGAAGSDHILLHPMAVAALAGMLLTAINLLPLGQLDGGHVVYAVFGERWHRIISTCMVALLVVMGKFYFPWWIWAVVMFFFGRRHPLVYDTTPPNATRRWLAVVTLLIFLLCASLVPTRL